ncbi:hypothetical protein B9Z65_6223 [Elsinoe australis]|uniref:Hydroxyacyl-thioester dehydratase type 2, mitochondrial n=1 Tax=Elsinoe australis TaxID=40998 RepID=A0A2P8A808_9PEZI|nr:hypothetical protein B9Z65_6223 [Elsinoe australis]
MKSFRAVYRGIDAFRISTRRCQSSYAHLEPEMQARKIRPIFDDLTPLNSFRLDVSLADFIPGAKAPTLLPQPTSNLLLPVPHHLLYFEPTLPAPDLLPDGTNPAHSPGAPFHRRMWAGGNVLYSRTSPLPLSGARAVCIEGIRSATVKGRPGSEKVFVGIERRLGLLTSSETSALAKVDAADEAAVAQIEDDVRGRLWRDRDDDMGECGVVERRNIVFLQDEGKAEKVGDAALKEQAGGQGKKEGKILKPNREATLFRHTIVPDSRLLFRFSALTFNAHAIHLDPLFCREKEGHRDLLFHGPLSFTFLMVLLQRNLGGGEKVGFVEYRNLAPVYCNEEITFCGAKDGEGKYEVWAEGPDGGVKVKGTVRTARG